MGNPVTRDELNTRLCEAFGVDPEENAGFRLTVLGGQVPALEVFQLPPLQGDALDDGQVAAVESIVHRFLVVPGDAPEAMAATDDADPVDPEMSDRPEQHTTAVVG
jgi:hypothetical protein